MAKPVTPSECNPDADKDKSGQEEEEEADYGCICEVDISQQKKINRILNDLLVKHMSELANKEDQVSAKNAKSAKEEAKNEEQTLPDLSEVSSKPDQSSAKPKDEGE
jgi:hypothetical protein